MVFKQVLFDDFESMLLQKFRFINDVCQIKNPIQAQSLLVSNYYLPEARPASISSNSEEDTTNYYYFLFPKTAFYSHPGPAGKKKYLLVGLLPGFLSARLWAGSIHYGFVSPFLHRKSAITRALHLRMIPYVLYKFDTKEAFFVDIPKEQ